MHQRTHQALIAVWTFARQKQNWLLHGMTEACGEPWHALERHRLVGAVVASKKQEKSDGC
jgi:enoyl-CoA hydratase/carnithine racemase